MSASPLSLDDYQKLPPEKRSRPLTDQEYGQLSPEQLDSAGLGGSQGAPADFGGRVLANPNGIQPKWDNEPPPVTRLPKGVNFEKGNYSGGAKMDTSNPLPAEVMPEMGREIGAQMSPQKQAMPWEEAAQQSTAMPWEEARQTSAAKPYIAPPADAPSLANAPGNPHSQPMSGVRTLTGTPYNPGRMERGIVDQIGGALQMGANVSTPVIAHRVLQRAGVAGPNSRLYPQEGTLRDTARDATLLMAGGAEGLDAEPAAVTPRIAAPKAVAPAAESEGGIMSRAFDVAKRRASHIPGVQAVKDADHIVRGDSPTPSTPRPIAKPPATIPETNGIPWGTGGKGPLSMRGGRLPEEDPALTSESRTLPGQVGKEVIGRVARPTVEPIPPRSGLALPAPREPIATTEHPNFPTPESRAASDAAFARLHPNEEMPAGMSADAQRAWQESAGFKSEPVVDIGAKVRAKNPEPTRAEVKAASAAKASGPIGEPPHSEWPPPEPAGPYSQVPKHPRGLGEVRDDAAVKQDVESRIAQSDRKWMAQSSAERAARNSPAVRKGVLTGQVDEHGIPVQPIAKPTGPRGLSPAGSAATDLTPEWTKALEDLKAKKAQKENPTD